MTGSPAVESFMPCKVQSDHGEKVAISAFIIADKTWNLFKQQSTVRYVARDRLHNRALRRKWRRSERMLLSLHVRSGHTASVERSRRNPDTRRQLSHRSHRSKHSKRL